MLASRFLFLVVTLVAWALNGAALLQHFSLIDGIEGLIPAALVANIVLAPALLWAAYKSGELVEEAYRKRLATEVAAAGTATLENRRRMIDESQTTQPPAHESSGDAGHTSSNDVSPQGQSSPTRK